MTHPIVMPQQGLTMEEGTFLGFLVEIGEKVASGQELLEIETDKAVIRVEANESGYLRKSVATLNQTYPVGTVLGYLTDGPDEPVREA